ncbi:hypothetical protein Unana1_03196 [Umbelopsis nana]
MVRRAKQNAAEASDQSSHLSDTSSLSSDPPGSAGSDKDSDDEDDDNRRRGVKPKPTSKKVLKKQAGGRKTAPKSKQPAAAASKAKSNRSKSIPQKKLKDSHRNLYKNAGTDQQYCICRGGYNGKEFMVACDSCQEWFHGRCIGIYEKDVPDHYFCANCKVVSGEEAASQKELKQGKKGKKSSKSKTAKAKGASSPKAQRKKAEARQELPVFKVEDVPIKPAIVEQDADMDGSDEDLDDICPVCDSECTCGTKSKNEVETFTSVLEVPQEATQPEIGLVHDSGVIEIIGDEPAPPKRSKTKTKAAERKAKSNITGADEQSATKKRSKSKKAQALQETEVTEENVDDVDSLNDAFTYQSDISEAAHSHGSFLEGPFSFSEGSVHIESGDDEDIEEEEERALIEQWELLQDQDELSDTSSEEDYDLDDEETMALMLEDQYETDEEMHTNEFLRRANAWSSDEDDEEEFDEGMEDPDSDDVGDEKELDEESDDDVEYYSEEGDAEDMQFSPFFDENTDVSELLDNIAAALALSISLPAEAGEDASDLTQQLQRALVEAGIDLSTIDERHPGATLSEIDEPDSTRATTANDSDVDITGTPDDVSAAPAIGQLGSKSADTNTVADSESAAALSQSLVSDLLLASGQGATADGKIDSEMIAAAVQDIVNAVTSAAKQEALPPSSNGSDNLLDMASASPNQPTSPSESSTGQLAESSTSSLKRDPEEEAYNDRHQRRRLSTSVENISSQKEEESELTAVLIDDLVDTSRLYTRSTSRSPSPEPAESNRFSQDLSRWQRVPIGTFRRSRRVSAPMIHASTALRSGNDEFASTLLCDLDANPATEQSHGQVGIADNATVPKRRRRPKHRGRSAAKSMSDLASIIQRSKDLLPANINALQGDQAEASLTSQGIAANSALPSSLSLAIASAVAAFRQFGTTQPDARADRRQLRQGSLSSGLDTDQPPSSACSSPLYSPLFSGIRHGDLSIPDLHLDEVVAELQKQEDNEKSASQRKSRRPSKLSSA